MMYIIHKLYGNGPTHNHNQNHRQSNVVFQYKITYWVIGFLVHQTFSCSATHLLVSYEKHFSQYIYFNLNFTV